MKNKKIITIFIIFSVLLVIFGVGQAKLDVASDLQDTINEQLKIIDLSDLDKILQNTIGTANYGAKSFLEKVKQLINGEYTANFSSILSFIFSTLLNGVKAFLPSLCIIIAISILCNLVGNFKGKNNKSLSEIVHFVCFSTIIVIVCSQITNFITLSSNTISSMKEQMEATFPIILTLMATVGNTTSVGIYQPTLAILSGGIINIFNYFILPVFVISFLLNIVGNISKNIKLSKFSSLLNDVFKWAIGGVFTIFTGVLAVKGISAGSFDGVSIRTAKFAMKTYIPIVGGYLSDGFNILMASSVLIKNSIGVAGLLLVFLSIIYPVITILLYKWCLHLISSILEPLMDDKISAFLFGVSKTLNMLIASILCVALMYIISTALLLTSGNIYWG